MSKKKPPLSAPAVPSTRAKKKRGAAKPAAPVRAATTSEWAHVWQSPIHGQGIRASRDIPSGTRIMEYEGERITKAESERRDAARAALDGHMEWNTARLINHSCEPNCQSEKVRGRIWISARRDIAAGEELSFDYGFDVENWRQHPCLCGSPKCVGYIVAKSHRWRLRKRLAKLRRATPAK
jgi:hypothetical protein